ncbi:hypothetical protein [Alkalihalobacillus trypoxylicola]|uniref:Uncharacterized protein n=1 Tax=Alkalihalobacillus trypoxylicola TaxID=519424 RepID=A0A162CM94_9BACI|nr:hypothetical protein [Alkalihalobacillus trypoxylicola]KYG25549.1 hypothetical protein AZF04_13745 [Alkalihalobacillus trypoxylicola]
METNFNDFTVHMSKEQLNEMVYDVMSNNYRIFWGFNDGKMILNIYNKHVNNKLIFVKNHGILELIDMDLNSIHVEKALLKSADGLLLTKANHPFKNKTELLNEIDLQLERLFWYQKQSDEPVIQEIKKKLAQIVQEYSTWLSENP